MLKVDNLTISAGDKTIISDASFELKTGRIYSILGQNGEGKSLLLKSLSLLLDRNHFDIKGEISFENYSLKGLNKNELNTLRQNSFRYVFQDAINMFDPLKKLNYYFNEYLTSNESAVERIFNDLLLGDYKNFMNSYTYEISTGQAQRVSFALGLLAQPRLLILDEPTSALDQINGNIYLSILKGNFLPEDSTVLLVTHDYKFALKLSDEFALLKNKTLSSFKPIEKLNNEISEQLEEK
jgi:ABC-type glutathione transport system ATPase component